MLELYLGGARSGKSRLAEQRALASGDKLVYIATATAGDDEMAQRIEHHRQQRSEHHRQQRSEHWMVVEEPHDLAAVISEHAARDRCLLVDCLTLWLSNWLIRDNPDQWQQARAAFLETLRTLRRGRVILVSNEVGQGIVPINKLSRVFVDEAGRLHQELAQICDRVVFVVAGLPQVLKGEQN